MTPPRAVPPSATPRRPVHPGVLFLVLAIGLAAPAAAANPVPWIVEFYRAAVAAQARGEVAAYEGGIRAALERAPTHAALLRHLARALAAQGRADEALEALGRAASSGVDLGIESDTAFVSLRGDPRFAAVLDRVARNHDPVGDPALHSELPFGGDLVEGIAVDPRDGTLYVGSVVRRRIYRIPAGGEAAVFADASSAGLLGVLGLRVDPARGVLWACSSAFPGMQGFAAADAGRAALTALDLATGRPVRAFAVGPSGGADRNLNDVAVAPNGDVYVTEAGAGAVYRLPANGDSLEFLLGEETVPGANGIDVAPGGRALYVSCYSIGILRVDLATRAASLVAAPDSVALLGVDGLLCAADGLVVVQNYPGLDRVAFLDLDPAGTAVTGMRVLAAHSPLHEEPTTAAVHAGRVFYLGNSQFNRATPEGALPPPETLDASRILTVRLP